MLDYDSIYSFFRNIVPDGAEWLVFAITGFTLAFIVINVATGITAVYTWFERRALGRFQSRLGPNRWGPFGSLQPMADLLKLLTKEDTVPETADRPVMTLAPILMAAPALVVFGLIPLGPDSFLGRVNVGLLFILGISSSHVLAIFMAGWGSRNKYAMFGAERGVAMLLSYEVPMALALVGPVMLAGSISLLGIVNGQSVAYLFVQPTAFLVFVIAASAEMSRTPFDMIESESELGAGYHTEFSGIKFGIFQLAEFMAPIVASVIATVVFLGGTRGPDVIPGQVWFVAKAFSMVFLFLWVRATWPRLRVDQIMGFAWKGLFPLALLNMFLIATEVVVLQDSTGVVPTDELWIMAGVNWLVTILAIIVAANVLGQRKLRPEEGVPSPLADMGAEAD